MVVKRARSGAALNGACSTSTCTCTCVVRCVCAAGIKELAGELGSSNLSLDLNRSASASQANMEGGGGDDGEGPPGRRASELMRRGTRSSLTAASLIDAIILDQIKRTDPDDLGAFCSALLCSLPFFLFTCKVGSRASSVCVCTRCLLWP